MNDKELCKRLAGNNDEYIFLSGVCDKLTACRTKNSITATKFLDARHLSLTKQLLTSIGCNHYIFDGGTPEAERMICMFLPDYPVKHQFLKCIRAEKAKQDVLTHRDYLGALMGLGLNRDCIGDIFVHDSGADIVVLQEIVDFLMLEYQKAGRKKLSLTQIEADEIKSGANDSEIRKAIVPSMRLDAITGVVFKLSRADSAGLIQKGKVFLNSAECLKSDKAVTIGDRITIRGKGKVEVVAVTGKTRKDRMVLEVKIFGGKNA